MSAPSTFPGSDLALLGRLRVRPHVARQALEPVPGGFMALVTGKCKWGHNTPNLLDSVINGKRVAATLCALCLADLDPEVRRNAGRVMHPDRCAAWTAKKLA